MTKSRQQVQKVTVLACKNVALSVKLFLILITDFFILTKVTAVRWDSEFTVDLLGSTFKSKCSIYFG